MDGHLVVANVAVVLLVVCTPYDGWGRVKTVAVATLSALGLPALAWGNAPEVVMLAVTALAAAVLLLAELAATSRLWLGPTWIGTGLLLVVINAWSEPLTDLVVGARPWVLLGFATVAVLLAARAVRVAGNARDPYSGLGGL